VFVDSRFVGKEIFINIKTGLNRSIVVDFSLDGSNTVEGVGRNGEVLRSRPVLRVRASRSTVRGGHKVKARLVLRRASGNGVRVAALSNQTSSLNVLPSALYHR
jgi:hypothetical protein